MVQKKRERDPQVLVKDLNKDRFCLPSEADVERTFLHYNNEQDRMGSLCLGDIILSKTSQAKTGSFIKDWKENALRAGLGQESRAG